MIPEKRRQFLEIEELGRERLSPNFFFREFLHSEISQLEKVPNLPHFPDRAIHNGSRLCLNVLEPLQARLGRLSVRSGYRSPEINQLGAKSGNQYNCAKNERNYSRHIWDYPDENGKHGATACVVVCSYVDYYQKTGDWQSLANWIHTNIPGYSAMSFFTNLCAFNISWHESPQKLIRSFIYPKGQHRPTTQINPDAPLPIL